MKNILPLASIIMMSLCCYANSKKIEYHCPPANHVDTHRHEYAAYTIYNGIGIDWIDFTHRAPDHIQVTEFQFVIINSEHNIGCVYKISNSGTIRLNPTGFNEFKYYPANGNWRDNLCESREPENCVFFIVEDKAS